MKFKLMNENFRKDYGANILRARGVEDIDKFLHPSINCLQDYHALANIDAGVDLFDQAMNQHNPKIALVVDCDVDGFTSSAILYNYIVGFWDYVQIDYFLHEGKQHGLSDQYQQIIENDTDYDLVIVPDAGSNDGEYIQQLIDARIPVLVIDHHLVDKTFENEECVIINNQLSPEYANKDLSGAGMAFQFCRALDAYYGLHRALDFLDLAAVGVCGDMMSALSIENQFIWYEGFGAIKNYFLQVLCEKQAFSMGNVVNPTTVAFYIVPMINALIRVGTMEEKRNLFEAFINGHKKIPSKKRCAKGALEEVAIESARECTNAKSHQDKLKKEISESLEVKIQKHDLLSNKILVVRLDDDDDAFPSEMTGLIAMQLSKQYNRPTIVARLNSDDYVRGSARGLNDSEMVSFKNFLMGSGYFEYAQGHDNAFGCSIKSSDLDAFHQYANDVLKDVDFGSTSYNVNFVRSASEKDIADICYDIVNYEDIWGQQNNAPLIAITDLFVTRNEIQVIGKNKDTLKIEKNGITYIKFFAKNLVSELQYPEMKITLVGKCNVNSWGGRTSPQIMIEDLEFEDANLAF